MPEAFGSTNIQRVLDYPTELRKALASISPRIDGKKGLSVILTPGQYNSAYFEHSYLARKMGCQLVQGCDLFVYDKKVYLKTTKGPELVTVIYRRIDDRFLDPKFFNPESMLGVDDLMQAYIAGNVVLANAVGNGIANDKAVYPYVHKMIEYYLKEKPLLAQIKTLKHIFAMIKMICSMY